MGRGSNEDRGNVNAPLKLMNFLGILNEIRQNLRWARLKKKPVFYDHPEPVIVDILWDDPDGGDAFAPGFNFTCLCGSTHYVEDFSFTDRWKCECGEHYFCDVAARIWGTQALINAGMLSEEDLNGND